MFFNFLLPPVVRGGTGAAKTTPLTFLSPGKRLGGGAPTFSPSLGLSMTPTAALAASLAGVRTAVAGANAKKGGY